MFYSMSSIAIPVIIGVIELCAGMPLAQGQGPTQQVGQSPSPRKVTEAEIQQFLEERKDARAAWMASADLAARRCAGVFGTKVNFRKPVLNATIKLIPVVPIEDRQSLADKRLDERLRKWQRPMLERYWFAPGWGPDEKHREPVAYHLRSLDGPSLDSTLYYEWESHGVKIRVTESSAGALVELENPSFDLRRGVDREKVVAFLRSVLKIPNEVSEEPQSLKMVPLDLGKFFQLPELLREGGIFGSLDDTGSLDLGFCDWYEATMGFATEKSICIAVWRPDHAGHLGQKGVGAKYAHGLGHFEDPTWLDEAIFESDGKKPIRPQSKNSKVPKRDEP